MSGELAVGQFRQLSVVPPRQVLPYSADLILDDVMVVAEPVFRGNRLRGSGRRREKVVGFVEQPRAFVQDRQERPSARRLRREPMRGGQRGRVRFELLLTEEDRRLRPVVDDVGDVEGGAYQGR